MKHATQIAFSHVLIPVCLSFLLLTGCSSPSIQEATTSSAVTTANMSSNLKDRSDVLMYVQSNNLVAFDPESRQNTPLKRLIAAQTPPSQTLSTFKSSPSHQYIVWYTAAAGLLQYDVLDESIVTLTEPNDWLNSDPGFFAFDQSKEALLLYLASPTTLVMHDLATGAAKEITIDNQNGPGMLIAPDGTMLAIIEGFNQAETTAAYTIVDIDTGNSTTIHTKAQPQNRQQVGWAQDSSGLVLLEDGSLTYYPISDPDNAEKYDTTLNVNLSKLTYSLTSIAVISGDNNIYAVDSINQQLHPINTQGIVVAALHALSDNKWVGIEEVSGEDIVTARLWMVSTNASPALLLPEYTHQAKLKFPESNELDLTY